MPTTVLLCDTPDEVARFQYHLLREHDLEVEVTTDAFRGVEAAVRSRPEVIVSELTLEGLGGAELVKRFLASSPTSRFVAHTVVRDPVKVTEVLAAGSFRLRAEGRPGRGLPPGDPSGVQWRRDPVRPGCGAALERAVASGEPLRASWKPSS